MKSHANATKVTCGLSVLLAASVSLPAAAQQLEEVVVTATKRSESLQDVPISVTAFSQEDMDLRGFSNLQGVQESTPNLNFSVQSAGQNVARVTLRGIGTETLIGGGDPGVALHIDGIYVGRNSAAAGDIFDVARVEVLRGPQGTLFGRNATGGSINIITQRPTEEFEANIDAAIGNFNARRIRGVVNGPLSDSTSGRLAVFLDQRDGYIDNLYNGNDPQDKDSVGFRGQVQWDTSEDSSVLLRAYYSDHDAVGPGSIYLGRDIQGTENGYPGSYLVGISAGPRPPAGARVNAPLFSFVSAADGSPLQDRPSGLHQVRKDAPEFMRQTMSGIDLDASFMLSDSIRLQSLSSYQTNDNEILVDADNSEADIETRQRNNEAKQWSQEFNLLSESDGNLQWILGAYYYHEELTEDFESRTRPGLVPDGVNLPPGAVPGGGGIVQNRTADHEVDSYALFARLSYDFSDATTFTAGMRQTWDEKSQFRAAGAGQLDQTNGYRAAGRGAREPLGASTADGSWSEPTFRISLNHKLSDDNMIFASVSKGYKSGGFDFNGGVLEDGGTGVDLQVPYEPEFVNAYEVGSKNKFMDGRVLANLTAFYYDYEDLQVFRLTGNGPLTDNAGQSTIYGFEGEFEFAVSEQLLFDASFGYLDATYDEYIVERPVLTSYAGKTLNYSPEWTGHVGAEYRTPLSGGELIVRGDWSYRSDTYFDRANTEFDTQEAYSLLNARIRFDAGKWFADIYAMNLADEEYVVGQLINPPFNCGCRTVNVGPPRTYGVTVGYRWD